MKRMHVNVQVRDLDESLAFYTGLFGAGPDVRKHDYAKWMLDDPKINFSIAVTGGAPGLRHVGIQADSREELAVLRQRAAAAGGRIREEGETVCCYARSDKTWITDAQGLTWEMFYTFGAADERPTARPARADESGAKSCCEPGCCGGAVAGAA